MSEIAFVEELGEAFDQVFNAEAPRAVPRWRRSWTRRRGALLLAAVLVGGCTATAAKLLSGRPTQYLMGQLTCNANVPTPNGQGVDNSTVIDPHALGQMPQLTCSGLLGVPASELTACANPKAPRVFVYKSTGPADTCKHKGLVPLPASFRHAAGQVAALDRGLVKLQNSEVCYRPAALVIAVRKLLTRIGFTGWSVRQANPGALPVSGPCGSTIVPAPPASSPRHAQQGRFADALAAPRVIVVFSGQTIDVYRTSAAGVAAKLRTLSVAIAQGTGGITTANSAQRCDSLAAAERYSINRLRAAGLHGPVRFAGVSEPSRDDPGGPYERGCVSVWRVNTGPDGRTLLVTLWKRGAPPIPLGPNGFPEQPPLRDFHPATPA